MAAPPIRMKICQLPTPTIFDHRPFDCSSLLEMRNADSERFDEDDQSQVKISNFQAAWNIFNANQGVVILSLPFAVKLGGFIPVAIVTVIVAFLSNYTSKNLIRCLYETDIDTGIRVRVRHSYDDVGNACGGLLGRMLVCAAMIVEQLCYCTVNLILCSNILYNAFSTLPLQKSHWVIITFVILTPNALLGTLQQVSILSLVTVIAGNSVYVAVSAYCFADNKEWFDQSPFANCNLNGFFTAAGIIVASYASQPYMPAIEGSMSQRKKFNTVADATFLIITVIKIGFGWLGFEAYGDDTHQVITNNLPRGIFRSICVAIVLVLALMSFTFPAFTVYTLVDKITAMVDCQITSRLSPQYQRVCYHDAKTSAEGHTPYKSIVVSVREVFCRMMMLSVSPMMAIFIPHFGYYVALVGNVTGICLSLIFPSLCYVRLKYRCLTMGELVLQFIVAGVGCLAAGIGVYFSSSALYNAMANEQT